MFGFMHTEIKSIQFGEEIWPGARLCNTHLHTPMAETMRMIRSTIQTV